MTDFFELYDVLIGGVTSDAVVTNTLCGECWTAVETADHFGMAMTTPVDTAPRMLSGDYIGKSIKEIARAAKSWNLTEAGFGMAAINAFYNTPQRLETLGAFEPFDNYCTDGLDLKDKTIGIIGMGNIGSKVARIAEAFGMKVCYFSTSGTGHCKDYPCLSLEELLMVSDIVSIHAPLNERTKNLIGKEQLALMKPSAFLVNVGRGAIVIEEDLADAVDDGVIAGAGMDVFVQEPIPEDHPYLKMKHPERMRLAPHVAWASVEARKRLVDIMAENVAKGW